MIRRERGNEMDETTAPDLRGIEEALDELLAVILDERDKRAGAETQGITASPYAWPDPRDKSHWQNLKLQGLVARPVESACREMVKTLGRHLYRLTGSFDAMQEAAERVADRDPPRYGRRASILNSAWDGIGGWAA